jgi:hypothetical protein
MNNQAALHALTRHLFDFVSRFRKPGFILYKNNRHSLIYCQLKPVNPSLIEKMDTCRLNKNQ